jgi:hypothetical protein
MESKMTLDELIDEGRRLQRRTILLSPEGAGDCAAYWYGHAFTDAALAGHSCWISVDAKFIPSCDVGGWLSIFTDDVSFEGGRVDVSRAPWKADGVPLYAKEIQVLPPIDAVLARGSSAIGEWLAKNEWQREWGFNSNFADRAIVEQYEGVERRENPLFWQGAYATLGGWNIAWPENDWHELVEAKLLVHTYMDSEPWVEAWQLPSGGFKVIQRIT